jgi:hypothetical protein
MSPRALFSAQLFCMLGGEVTLPITADVEH